MISNNHYEIVRESFDLLEKYIILDEYARPYELDLIRPGAKQRSSLDMIFSRIKRESKRAMELKAIIQQMASVVK